MHERRDRDVARPPGGQRPTRHVVAHHPAVVRDRVGEGLHRRPHRCVSHLVDHRGRQPDPGRHEVGDGVAPPALGDESIELLEVVGRKRRPAVVHDEGRLVHRELRDREPADHGLDREGRARRVAEHEPRTADGIEQCREVLDLALDRVRRGVAAVAPAPPVVGHHREPRREHRGQIGRCRPVAQGATDDDQRRAVTRPLERDRRAVGGTDGVHRALLVSRWPAGCSGSGGRGSWDRSGP